MSARIEETIFHSLFAKGFQDNGFKGIKVINGLGTLGAKFDETECEIFMQDYDQVNCINIKILIEFIKDTQLDKYNELAYSCSDVEQVIKKAIIKKIDTFGILKVLKDGFTVSGIGQTKRFEVFAKQPSENSVGKKAQEDYAKNQFWCIHEFKYCEKTEERIDFAIFLNGLPIFDFELKDKLSGSQYTYIDAIKQYEDRVTSSKTKETIHRYWSNKTGMLAHFAIDNNDVYVCTEVKEKGSRFIPFNIGIGKGISKHSGNPKTKSGYNIEYIYKKLDLIEIENLDYVDNIFEKDKLADFINNFLYYENDKLIFPRYHQLNVVLRLEKDIKQELLVNNLETKNYLIQHSAGSGKTKSITWLAYRLEKVKDMSGTNLFNSIIVLTDRNVVIGQLGESINASDKKEDDMVVNVEKSTNKSDTLKKALKNEKRIITCTIQSFLDLKKKMPFPKDKKFVVIIDESHSSTDGKDIDAVRDSLTNKKGQLQVSFIGFTATPKKGTLISFGIPDGTTIDKNGKKINSYIPFDVYSMRQAIEEKYILDVFECYKTIDAHCNIIQLSDDKEVNVKYAKKVLDKLTKEKGLSLEDKVNFIIEDFDKNVYNKLDGEEKAMILTDSKESAIEYYEMLKEKLLKFPNSRMNKVKILIAFSGKDRFGKEENNYNELSITKNGSDMIQTTFDKEQLYKMLLVVDKYQTGYDQPKLCVMYIDKDLKSEVQIVQTLSRLNRPYYKEDGTIKPISIIDFRNSFEDVKAAFEQFYETTHLNREHKTHKDLEEKRKDLFDNHIVSNDMMSELKKGQYTQISQKGQELENDKKFGDKSKSEVAGQYIAKIYDYTRLYDMLIEDPVERNLIKNNDYQTIYQVLIRLKNYVSSTIKPKTLTSEDISNDVGAFVVGVDNVENHTDEKTLSASGAMSQKYRDMNLGEENKEREKLSKIINQYNGLDDNAVNQIVDTLSHKQTLIDIATNSSNTKQDFLLGFEKVFYDMLEKMLDANTIDFEKYNIWYDNCKQIGSLTYKKIKNTQ